MAEMEKATEENHSQEIIVECLIIRIIEGTIRIIVGTIRIIAGTTRIIRGKMRITKGKIRIVKEIIPIIEETIPIIERQLEIIIEDQVNKILGVRKRCRSANLFVDHFLVQLKKHVKVIVQKGAHRKCK